MRENHACRNAGPRVGASQPRTGRSRIYSAKAFSGLCGQERLLRPNREGTFAVPAIPAADTIWAAETTMQPTSRRSFLGWVVAIAIITVLPSALNLPPGMVRTRSTASHSVRAKSGTRWNASLPGSRTQRASKCRGVLSHAAATPTRHRFIAVDDGTHTLVHVDENNPARNWSVATGYVMDMQLVGQDREGRIVWRYGRPHASFVEVVVLDGISGQGLPTASEQ